MWLLYAVTYFTLLFVWLRDVPVTDDVKLCRRIYTLLVGDEAPLDFSLQSLERRYCVAFGVSADIDEDVALVGGAVCSADRYDTVRLQQCVEL